VLEPETTDEALLALSSLADHPRSASQSPLRDFRAPSAATTVSDHNATSSGAQSDNSSEWESDEEEEIQDLDKAPKEEISEEQRHVEGLEIDEEFEMEEANGPESIQNDASTGEHGNESNEEQTSDDEETPSVPFVDPYAIPVGPQHTAEERQAFRTRRWARHRHYQVQRLRMHRNTVGDNPVQCYPFTFWDPSWMAGKHFRGYALRLHRKYFAVDSCALYLVVPEPWNTRIRELLDVFQNALYNLQNSVRHPVPTDRFLNVLVNIEQRFRSLFSCDPTATPTGYERCITVLAKRLRERFARELMKQRNYQCFQPIVYIPLSRRRTGRSIHRDVVTNEKILNNFTWAQCTFIMSQESNILRRAAVFPDLQYWHHRDNFEKDVLWEHDRIIRRWDVDTGRDPDDPRVRVMFHAADQLRLDTQAICATLFPLWEDIEAGDTERVIPEPETDTDEDEGEMVNSDIHPLPH
jgi:hypothetical protein